MNKESHHHPTVEVPTSPPPPWDPLYEDPMLSPETKEYLGALKCYLPSSELEHDDGDNFRMYEFKIRKCGRGRSHDWTECPYAHPGEKARRRDPRKYHYAGTSCPEFRRGSCRKGDTCELSHGVFECWLHPARYRTQACKDGPNCKRRVCFFAHTPHQLRVLPESPSPRYTGYSPTSVFDSFPDSPPLSPCELANAFRGLHVGPRNVWGVHSPHIMGSPGGGGGGYMSAGVTRSGLGMPHPWELCFDQEVPMERVESGKFLRAKMYAKLSKDNSLDPNGLHSLTSVPDFDWVSDLLK